MQRRSLAFWLSALLLLSGVARSEETELLSVGRGQLQCQRDARAEIRDREISLRFDDPRASMKIVPPHGVAAWDWSTWKYFVIEIQNVSDSVQLRLNVQLTSHVDKRKDAVIGVALNPGERRTLRMPIPHPPAMPDGVPGPRSIDTHAISAVEFFLQWSFEPTKQDLVNCLLINPRLEGRVVEAPAKTAAEFFPFVDRYGQYVHADWPEKIRAPEDMQKAREAEARLLATAKRPSSWNEYGGWKDGPHLEATGNFRTEKHKGKWWLVDPAGRLFFSHGLDVLYPHTDSTSVKDHEHWYECGRDGRERLPFTDDNLKIKYGKDDYASDFYATLTQRMEAWGFNSIGNWGQGEYMIRGDMPYALQLTDFRHHLPRMGKLKLNDVYDERFVQETRSLIADAGEKHPIIKKSLTDPLCIGYFIDNEIRFGYWRKGHCIALVQEVIGCPPEQAAKQEWAGDLTLKYQTVERLNKAWTTTYGSWQDVLTSTDIPPDTESFAADSQAFLEKTVDRYFQLCSDAIKSVAPHRLYLGCRFLSTESVDPLMSAASKRHCDVMTVNIYAHTAANFPVRDFVDMPVLIGEFHFGTYDRGMFAPGLCLAGTTQDDRAIAYTRFMQGALVHPNIVGAHWFQFRDQPLTGRWDGEGYQVGFVDVADTPYTEMTQAARRIGENMYTYRMRGELRNEMQ